MKRYQKVGHADIYALKIGDRPAIDIARANYAKYSSLNFDEDLKHYMREGLVWSWPNFFMMAKLIERDGRRGWFVQMLVGDLGQLLVLIPCPVDFVAFCRNNDDNMRIVDFDECVRMAAAVHGYFNKRG